jgi:hypothetical protein
MACRIKNGVPDKNVLPDNKMSRRMKPASSGVDAKQGAGAMRLAR